MIDAQQSRQVSILQCALYALALLSGCGTCVPETEDHQLPRKHAAALDTARAENQTKPNPTKDSLNDGGDLGMQNAPHAPSVDTSALRPRPPGNMACAEGSCGACREILNVLAALRDAGGSGGEPGSGVLSRFGVCVDSEGPSRAALMELSQAAKSSDRAHGPGVLRPRKEPLRRLGEGVVLTLDLPNSLPLKLKPTLLLVLGSPLPLTPNELGVTFSSESLHPDTQNVCVSGETRYIVLNGKAPESEERQSHKLRLLIESRNSDAGQKLRQILTDEGSGSKIGITPLLLFWSEPRADTSSSIFRLTQGVPMGTSPCFSGTFSFLCELQRFLSNGPPWTPPVESTSVRLQALESLPPMALGLSSSQTLLLGLLNSSAPTLFSFPTQGSVLRLHSGALALAPALLEVLKWRLEEATVQMEEVMEVAGDHGALESLRRLRGLCAFPIEAPAPGDLQYRALLLLKALQTRALVAPANRVKRGLQATTCGLQSLTVSLESYFVGPNIAAINNCGGLCSFPLHNGNNHGILLEAQIQLGHTLQRSLCCVPVAYGDLQVVQLNEEGTFLSIKPNMVAKECGCR